MNSVKENMQQRFNRLTRELTENNLDPQRFRKLNRERSKMIRDARALGFSLWAH